MPLKLMYITNRPEIALIAENAGVDRIFIDMEYIGKNKRQGGMDTVQCHHTFEDIKTISSVLTKSELLVRINPVHDKTDDYVSTEDEIDLAIESGAEILMLPYFKTTAEVERFLNHVNKRVKTMILVETPEAVEAIDEILDLDGIDEVFIGLNDLSLGYGMKFMFEPLANGKVEELCTKFARKGLKYGFGGIASLGRGKLPSEYIISEHYRLGSKSVILSRSFCNVNIIEEIEIIESIFHDGVKAIREYENLVESHPETYKEKHLKIEEIVQEITESL